MDSMPVMDAPRRVDTRDTSSAALDEFGLSKRQKQMREILDVCIAAERNGAPDLSLTECRDLYERQHPGRRMDLNRVSARVSDLVDAKILQRRPETRPCAVTGKPIHPFFVVPTQARLFR